MKTKEIKYPYEVKYSKQNIWIWDSPESGHWKINKESKSWKKKSKNT